MPAEIERKFLVDEAPGFALESPSEDIDQGYLVSDGEIEVRVRRKGGRCFLTVKKGHGESARGDRGRDQRRTQFEALWPLTEGWRVAEAPPPDRSGGRTHRRDGRLPRTT